MKLKGTYTRHGLTVPCKGEIEILRKNFITAYISWKMNDVNGRRIATRIRNYLLEKNEEELFQKVINNILNYRVGRGHKIFKDVLFVEDE